MLNVPKVVRHLQPNPWHYIIIIIFYICPHTQIKHKATVKFLMTTNKLVDVRAVVSV